MSSDEVLTWLTTRVTEDHIQLVSDTILEDLVEKVPYVACLFTGVLVAVKKASVDICQKNYFDVICG